MRQIGAIDRRFMMINLLLLMCIAFVPFPTRLIAEHFHDDGLRAAAITYGVTLTTTAVCFGSFWFYAARGNRLLSDDADPQVISGISRSYLPGAPIYGAATLSALWSPKVAVALFGAIALFYLLESSIFGSSRSR
jgi:uncharacterized membrane protein